MRIAKTLQLSLLIAVLSLGAIGAARAEACREETLPGSWRSMRSDNIWLFHADGKLGCEGPCRFTQVVGDPVSWAYEPNANVWSSPIEHVKLTFTKAVFEGVFGSFRCTIEEGGMMLRLEGDDGDPMVFVRQQQ